MRYGEAVRDLRLRVREGVADAVYEATPDVRGGRGRARAVRQATLDGLADAMVDAIMHAALPGMEQDLADMMALRLMSEVARRTTVGSA